MKPRLLDLFCGAGGAGMGYARVGFDLVGVDWSRQKRYPFEWHKGGALAWLEHFLVTGEWPIAGTFVAIHASPPCQKFSSAVLDKSRHHDLLTATRALLDEVGLPYVIENVPRSPMRADFKLCGCVVGLSRIERERWFETNWGGSLDLRAPCFHAEPPISVVGHDVPSHQRKLGRSITTAEKRDAMGIDWMSRDELSQAIPPAYTELIGRQLLDFVTERAA